MATNEERARAHGRGQEEHGRYYCRRCADQGVVRIADERYSMGVYAGMLCNPHWSEDGRNHDRQFDPMDAGEVMDADEY